MGLSVTDLPHLNATLNACASILLVIGWLLIRRGHEVWHKRIMLACFATSVLFLTSYLVYHYHVPSKRFPLTAPQLVRLGYLLLLASHVVLAAAVPFLAVATIYLGLRDKRAAHRRLARITFPIWLYVSITGVIVYVMLYWIYANEG